MDEKVSITFDRNSKIERGRFATVYHGILKLPVAVKRISKENSEDLFNEREVNIMRGLDHPNVVKFYGASSDEDFWLYAIELCQASLKEVFLKEEDPKKYKGPLPPKENILCQLAEGLKYIHEKGIYHRDLKPENVLIKYDIDSNQESSPVWFKWSDFGLSKIVHKYKSFSVSDIRGTKKWLAPEILQKMISGDGKVNLKDFSISSRQV